MQMSNPPTNKSELRKILLVLRASGEDATSILGGELARRQVDEAEQEIKQWVSETVIGADELDEMHESDELGCSVHCECAEPIRNKLKSEQRRRLEHG